MRWSDLGSFSFYDLRCHQTARAATASQVKCTFRVHDPPPDLQEDTFWYISMRRQSLGPWLITGYGTP